MSEVFAEIKNEEERLLCRSYSRYPLAIDHGQGDRLWDVDGVEYVDLLSGIGVTALGHCNPELCDVLAAQSRKLWHVSNLFYQRGQLALAEIILSTTHHNKAFFCNSGAEANEACIKLARRYARKIRNRDAFEIITISGCFHGRTLGALAATGRESLSDGFTPLPEGFRQVEAGNIEAMAKAIGPATAAVMLECVQGEGGVVPLSHDYLRAVEALCHERGVALICDEVQCGMCRTGKFWAFQHAGIKPDIISAAKALANGLPMGAMLATDEMARGFVAGSHATTFGGGALVSAVAEKVVEIMLRDALALRAEKVGGDLKCQLEGLAAKYPDKIREVRGIGLMIGIELRFEAADVWKKLLAAGFICNVTQGSTLRLLPPLVIGKEKLEAFVICLDEILAAA